MPEKTNLNVAPYFDDWDETKNFYKILFAPAVAVQARELTQLQTMLQHQVEVFGSNILKTGTIVKGGNFYEEKPLPYVKVLDVGTDLLSVVPTDYIGYKLIGSITGLEAIIQAASNGLESQTPNLNTFYIRYINTNDGGDKTFNTAENLLIYSPDGSLVKTVTVAGSADANAIGEGYGVRCGDGYIFQNGYFLRFTDEVAIVSAYDTNPNGVVVGFATAETIISAVNDTSLKSNAQGFNNWNAPGADRLKITPKLITKTLAEAAADETFFAIQEYQNGRVVRRNLTTKFNSVAKTLERRTTEESGNYTTKDFTFRVEDNDDANTIDFFISPGVAYVEGKRIELVNEFETQFDQSTEYGTEVGLDIVARYGYYIEVTDYLGNFEFQTMEEISIRDAVHASNTTPAVAPGNEIGTARLRSVERGDIDGEYRIYLADINMSSNVSSFSSARSVFYNGVEKGAANLKLVNGSAIVVEESNKPAFLSLGRSHIKTINGVGSDYIYRTKINTQIASNGILTVTLSDPDEFHYGQSATLSAAERNEIMVICSDPSGNNFSEGEVIDLVSATTSADGQVLTADVGVVLGTTMNVAVYYNAKSGVLAPIGKEIQTAYIKINANNNTGGYYCLGIPDVIEIDQVLQGTNSYDDDVANVNITDVTSSFTLEKNQKDTYYGLSYARASAGLAIISSDRLLFKVKTFKAKTTGAYDQTFFTVDSYPVDDLTTPTPDNKITTQEIPVYETDGGITVQLRDVIDLRPYAANTAAYADTMIAATENPASTLSFGTSELFYPAPFKSIELSYEYYLGRYDKASIDEDGQFGFLSGTPSEEPIPPQDSPRGMSIATIYVPPYPALAPRTANRLGKPNYGVQIQKLNNRGYTMYDIGKIDERVNRLEYYTALNALEKSTQDLVITDDNGLDRFKNGILVDNFTNFAIADVKYGGFSAGIDPVETEIHPRFRRYNLDLKVDSLTNATDHGEVVTLPKEDVSIINQPYATNIRSCTTSFYLWNGVVRLNPEYDSNVDTVNAPDINFDVDLATPFIEFTEKMSEFVPLTHSSSKVLGSNKVGSSSKTSTKDYTTATVLSNGNVNVEKGTKTTTTTTTKYLQSVLNQTTSIAAAPTGTEKFVGDFVTDIRFSPFLKSRVVDVYIDGLRPNTRFYFFFDKKDVNAHMAKAEMVATAQAQGASAPTIRRTSAFSAANVIKSDANGVLIAQFRIPPETFYVGDRVFEAMDVSRIADREAATSLASKNYGGFNHSVEKTQLTLSTRGVKTDLDTIQSVSQHYTTSSKSSSSKSVASVCTYDPIAQTFAVDADNSSDTHVHLTKVDLYFAKKSATRGVTVEIREVINGYPSGHILPFSRTHLESVDISANSNTAITATTVNFRAPVPIQTDTEYALVIIPDGNDPDYQVWISRVGEKDIDKDLAVTQDTNAGTVFTSTNNKAWTAYQDENLKFQLYMANFTQGAGSVSLTNKDSEFLRIVNITGKFQEGERVFVQSPSEEGNIIVNQGNTTIEGVNTAFTALLSSGEHIVYKPTSTTYEILQLEPSGVVENDTITVADVPFTSNANAEFFRTVTGTVEYFNNFEPGMLILDNSSAKTGLVFEANTTIVGVDSGATAHIEEVLDQPVSYTQPAISRINFSLTDTKLSGSVLTGTSGTYTKSMPFADNTYLSGQPTYISSRSNEITNNSGNKTFKLNVDLFNLSTTTRDTSPFVDHSISLIGIHEYLVNNDNTGENGNLGNADSKYIARTVTLADGLEAEDLRLFITAYRPPTTDVEVYVQFKSPYDLRNMNQVPWTKLEKFGDTDLFSSAANRYDYKEFEYRLPTTPQTFEYGAWRTTDSVFNYVRENGAVYDNYKMFKIKVVMLAESYHRVPRVQDLRSLALT